MKKWGICNVLGVILLSLLLTATALGNTGSQPQPGWQKNGDLWYYLDQAGKPQTGWLYDDGAWYYLDQSGYMRVGWVKADGNWYYLNESGRMTVTNRYTGDLIYKFASSGELLTVSVDKKVEYSTFEAFMLSAEEQDFLDSINEERAEYQQEPLVLDLTLHKIAEGRLAGALDYGYSERNKEVEGQGSLSDYIRKLGYADKGAVEIYIIDAEAGDGIEQLAEIGEAAKAYSYDKVGISIQQRNSRNYLMLILAK